MSQFSNGGTECFVLERSGNYALVWMPSNPATPYVIAGGYPVGGTEWDSGSYYGSLANAAKEFAEIKRGNEPQTDRAEIHGETAEEVFNELVKRLKDSERLPDEYLLLDNRWENGEKFPDDAEIICNVDYGGSEGIYLDVALRFEERGELVTKHFATGKTLGESGTDMDRMYLVGSAITQELNGNHIHSRWVEIPGGSFAERLASIGGVIDTIVEGVREPGVVPHTSTYDTRKAYAQLADRFGAENVVDILNGVRAEVTLKAHPSVLDKIAEEAKSALTRSTGAKEDDRDI